MTRVLPLLFLACAFSCAVAQSKPDQQGSAKEAASKLHADAVKLVEVSGARQRLKDGMTGMVEEGRKAMMEKCPACSPEFGDAWTRKMLERINIEDFLAVYVRVYEKYFNDDDLVELISMQKARSEGRQQDPSPPLKKKLDSVMPSVLGDSIGGCSEVGAKLGAEVGAEIEKEHPEYIKETPQDHPQK